MKLLGSINVLSCRQIEQSLEFYQQALQFVILNQRFESDALAWVHIKSGDVALMLERAQASMPVDELDTPDQRIYLFVDDVKDLHHFLTAKQFGPGELRETDYGALEFDTIDPEGRCITLGQTNADQAE